MLHDNPIFAERRVERYEGTYTCAMSEVGFHIIMLHTKPDIRFSNQAPHNNKFACPVNEWESSLTLLMVSVFGSSIAPRKHLIATNVYVVIPCPCKVSAVDTCKRSRYYTFLSRRLRRPHSLEPVIRQHFLSGPIKPALRVNNNMFIIWTVLEVPRKSWASIPSKVSHGWT